MKKNCVICGQEFETKSSSITCSDECRSAYNSKMQTLRRGIIQKKCTVCGNEFIKTKLARAQVLEILKKYGCESQVEEVMKLQASHL